MSKRESPPAVPIGSNAYNKPDRIAPPQPVFLTPAFMTSYPRSGNKSVRPKPPPERLSPASSRSRDYFYNSPTTEADARHNKGNGISLDPPGGIRRLIHHRYSALYSGRASQGYGGNMRRYSWRTSAGAAGRSGRARRGGKMFVSRPLLQTLSRQSDGGSPGANASGSGGVLKL